MTRVSGRALSLLVLASTAFACQEPNDTTKSDCDTRAVRMGVASSLRAASRAIVEDFATRSRPTVVEAIYGASSVHARQIASGAPLDLLVSADATIIDDLLERGLLEPGSAVEVARGQLSLLARDGWRARVSGPDAIDSFEVIDISDVDRIAVPAAAVPLGRYARHWLAEQGLLSKLAGRIVTTEHARATLTAVDTGLVDLAIAYRSDARLARRARVVFEIDDSQHPPIRYVAARVTRGPDCEAIDDVLGAWTAPTTVDRLSKLGFLPPVRSETIR